MAIKAIPTRYAGCEFRSRIEARHAVFLDTLGIAWEYEPEGYESDEGWRYLPDFWLTDMRAFLEIKGVAPTDDEQVKARGLSEATGNPLYVFFGGMQQPALRGGSISEGTRAVGYGANRTVFGWDKRTAVFLWVECKACHEVGIVGVDHKQRVNKSICECVAPTVSPSEIRLVTAYEAARSARFDRGMTRVHPAPRPKPIPKFTPARARHT